MTAEEQFQSIVRALRSDSRITTSKMFGSTGLVASGDGEHFDPGHGRKMKEWVVVGPRAGGQWLGLVREAKDFVTSGPGGTGRRSRLGEAMKQTTVRGIDAALARRLREEARRRGLSLNRTLILLLR